MYSWVGGYADYPQRVVLPAVPCFSLPRDLHFTANFIEMTCDIGCHEAVLPEI
jgi:hypothetical protein